MDKEFVFKLQQDLLDIGYEEVEIVSFDSEAKQAIFTVRQAGKNKRPVVVKRASVLGKFDFFTGQFDGFSTFVISTNNVAMPERSNVAGRIWVEDPDYVSDAPDFRSITGLDR